MGVGGGGRGREGDLLGIRYNFCTASISGVAILVIGLVE